MRAAGALLAVALLAGGCNRDKQIDRNSNVAKADLDKVVAHASAKAGVPPPGAPTPHDRAMTPAGYAWVGNWAKRRTLCPFRPWRLTRTAASVPPGESCRFRSVKGDPLGGDRIELACTTAGMKTDELWFAKFEALDRIRITRTVGSGVPATVTLVRCG